MPTSGPVSVSTLSHPPQRPSQVAVEESQVFVSDTPVMLSAPLSGARLTPLVPRPLRSSRQDTPALRGALAHTKISRLVGEGVEGEREDDPDLVPPYDPYLPQPSSKCPRRVNGGMRASSHNKWPPLTPSNRGMSEVLVPPKDGGEKEELTRITRQDARQRGTSISPPFPSPHSVHWEVCKMVRDLSDALELARLEGRGGEQLNQVWNEAQKLTRQLVPGTHPDLIKQK